MVTYTIDAGGACQGLILKNFLLDHVDYLVVLMQLHVTLMQMREEDGSCTYATATVDCDGNCIVGSPVTISLTDSYGDTWNGGSLNVAGVEYTQVGSYGWPYSEAL